MSKVEELNEWLSQNNVELRSVFPGASATTTEVLADELLKSLKEVKAELDREKGG